MVELIVMRSPDVLRNPRVPRPINVEFKVGCKELTDDKKPIEPSPWTVELIVARSPAVLRNPRVPSPSSVEFRVGCIEDIDERKPLVPRP